MMDRRCPLVSDAPISLRWPAQELTDRAPEPIVPVLVQEVNRAAVARHRLDQARVVTARAVSLDARAPVRRAEQEGQVAARRVAVSADVVGIDPVFVGMGPQPM